MDVVVHQGALGDFVLVWPVLAGLGATHIQVVTRASHGRLAQRVLSGVTAHDADAPAWSALFAENATVDRRVAALLQGARRIVSFVSNGDDAWARNARRIAPRAALYTVQPRPSDEFAGHVTQWHAEQLRQQGWPLPSDAALPLRVQAKSSGGVVVHPGSGGRAKCWPMERYAALIEVLKGQGLAVRVAAGEVEVARGMVKAAESGPEGHGLEARVCATLDELVDDLLGAAVYVGNDAGPTHLAAALGLGVVALFGPSNAARWAPRGRNVIVLAPPTAMAMTWLDVETVAAAVARAAQEKTPGR